MWEKKVKHNKVFYRLNASHPGVASLIATAKSHGISQEVTNFLHLIEETIPVPLILIDGSENPEKLGDQAQKKAPPEMHEVFRSLHSVLCAGGNAGGRVRAAGGHGTISPLPGIARGLQGTRTDRRLMMAEADELKNAVNHAILILKNKPSPTTADVVNAAPLVVGLMGGMNMTIDSTILVRHIEAAVNVHVGRRASSTTRGTITRRGCPRGGEISSGRSGIDIVVPGEREGYPVRGDAEAGRGH